MKKIIEKITFYDNGELENIDKQIEITGKVTGEEMTAAVVDILGWRLAISSPNNKMSIMISAETENDLHELKNLLKQSTINVSILSNLEILDESG